MFDTPAQLRLRAVLDAVETLGTTSGTVDAANAERIVVSYPCAGLGDRLAVLQSASKAFDDAGFAIGFMNVTDTNATFHLRQLAA